MELKASLYYVYKCLDPYSKKNALEEIIKQNREIFREIAELRVEIRQALGLPEDIIKMKLREIR